MTSGQLEIPSGSRSAPDATRGLKILSTFKRCIEVEGEHTLTAGRTSARVGRVTGVIKTLDQASLATLHPLMTVEECRSRPSLSKRPEHRQNARGMRSFHRQLFPHLYGHAFDFEICESPTRNGDQFSISSAEAD